ncbi:hypothetical protein, variant 1 [Aphanomyces astaci]|uniref:Uncharacterized protein n=1 Tax=Aphanomyces astaci TaxID=112090 RepID=W4GXT2_APHAT|nr:hypothetical protein, variant 1 [Aphanomyces astaci]ETV83713.1 hypothetical protein, variant 1 [Aphanomyces astaci]|eukprot:XP_009827148.1 hypothetical protein, variant 1 [Aphanomyces astaci]
MEQIFFRMHVRVSRTLSRLAGGKTRIAVETALFTTAMGLLATLVVLHLNFVSPRGQYGCLGQYMPPTLPPLMRVAIESDPSSWIHPVGWLRHRVPAKPNRNAFVFAAHKGLLTLLEFPEATTSTNLSLVDVTIPSSSACFGLKHMFEHSPAWSFFLDKVVGYDTIVINQMVHIANGRGFLRHELSKDVYNLNFATEFHATTATLHSRMAFKLGVLCTTLFLFFSTTTLVSFILRETQQRMLRFTLSLQHHIRHRMPYIKLVFSHIIESLVFVPIMVGMLFFLFEFFKDRLLAFMVMSVVWLCELYSVICVRTWLSLTFFPPVFLSLFALFHVYFFCFPFGFSYVALWTTVAFLSHQMLLFLNRFELPALRDGVVSAQWPRQFVVASSTGTVFEMGCSFGCFHASTQ